MIRGGLWKAWVGIWMALAIYWAFLQVRPAVGGFALGGQAAKIVFFHAPCAWLASLALGVAAVYAILTLRATLPMVFVEADFKCAAAMELGFLFALLATITGSIFAKLQWNAYWIWTEPRMISILVVLLIFAAYLVLRGSVQEPEKRGRLTAVYTLVSLVPGLFLIWVVPRIVETLHEGPNNTFISGKTSIGFKLAMFALAMPAFTALFVWLLQLRVRLFKLMWRKEARLESAAARP